MLLNPCTTKLETYPGTRALAFSLGIEGQQLTDPKEPWRVWTIQRLFAPIGGRRLGGIRAKLFDSHGFVTFCNQRDLEVLLGLGRPGARCMWLKDDYLEPEDPDWYGLCADGEDLKDDLHEREMQLLQQHGYPLPPKSEITRSVHYDEGNDVNELHVITNLEGMELERINRRWALAESLRVQWG